VGHICALTEHPSCWCAPLTLYDTRDYDGEQRFNSTGFLGTAIVTICHTETEDEIHIISIRKAELHEIETLSRYL
jgi:uncharacterized protein